MQFLYSTQKYNGLQMQPGVCSQVVLHMAGFYLLDTHAIAAKLIPFFFSENGMNLANTYPTGCTQATAKLIGNRWAAPVTGAVDFEQPID